MAAPPLPDNLLQSKGAQYVVSKGWNYRVAGDQLEIEKCPLCDKDNYHFRMAYDPSRDGLWMCFKCGESSNLRNLKERLGDAIAGVESRSEWAGQPDKKTDALPDPVACHANLLGDAEAMDYLLNVRGFTQEVIERQQLGLQHEVFFRKAGKVKALVIPYLMNGNIVYAKYRTLPPAEKDFISPHGWEAPLYNEEILKEGLKEVVFVEGEADCIACLSKGIECVVGVPGANIKKAAWIEKLDAIAPESIYILYDSDRVGQKAAQEIASRIGIDRCKRLVLPEFTVSVPGGERPGKDINEWFTHGGGTLERFDELKKIAKLFDVTGVTPTATALDELEQELEGKEDLAPSRITKWPEVNKLVGFEPGDVIDIVAPEKIGKTTFGLNLVDHMVQSYKEPGLIVCLEMTQKRLVKKWVSLVTGFEDTLTAPGSDESKAKLADLKEKVKEARKIQQEREADLYFAYPMAYDVESVFKLIRDCIRRYGVKWIMFDNLQLFCDNTLGRNMGYRTIHLSQLSKQFAKIAKDYQVYLVRILQPKRIAKGETVGTGDVDGSSQVAKDCDCMITLWRAVVGEMKKSEYAEMAEGFTEGTESFDPKTKVTVGLSRYSSGGFTYLQCEGAKSRFSSYPEIQKRSMAPVRVSFNGVFQEHENTGTGAIPIKVEGEVKI
jgi:KaiC/GvpD/RAD55 family RecA-like ATPase